MNTWKVVNGRLCGTQVSQDNFKTGSYMALRSYLGDLKCLGSALRTKIS